MEWKPGYEGSDAWRAGCQIFAREAEYEKFLALCREAAARNTLTTEEGGEEPTITAEELLTAMGGGFSVPMPPPVWPAGGFGLDGGKC